eukprot:TRINITY_DN22806_c0_g1_i3.p1 TRINITY_DN22806_c0_g1~~TRINITY_DN22806_c0_g1_i3.p1  ORF type:complete len:607 (-),score=85.80 TRINITY_DN22806_c0_g1_i3:214-2034(-)
MHTNHASIIPGLDNLWFHGVTFVLATSTVGLVTYMICHRYMKSSKDASDDYFAGGRGLPWYVVAGSLMLTNLSTEQLVGLNGAVFADGCLVGIWWEAGAAIAMVLTATVFLPRYIALGLTTTAGFLGERYDLFTRTLVSAVFLIYYTIVLCPLVLYTGALAIRNIFELEDVPLWCVSLLIGTLGACYALFGGLKAVAVSDCLNGLGLIIVGLWVPIAALSKIGGFNELFKDPDYLKPVLAKSTIYDNDTHSWSTGTPSVPWHVIITGMTLNNLYYWSTNQVIIQRVLASRSLAEGQKGVLFAAFMKVVGFSFLCLPGIIGLIMVKQQVEIDGKIFTVKKSDEIYPELVKAVMPTWSLGFFAAVLLGSVLSTFNSALNSASTIFGLEIYKIYIDTEASPKKVVRMATVFGTSLTLASFIIAPLLSRIDTIFSFLQQANTIVSLPIIVIFFIGIAASLPDAFAAKIGFFVGLLVCICGQFIPDVHYLHVYFVSFLLAAGVMALFTYVPLIRKHCKLEEAVPYVQRVGGNFVSLQRWRFLYVQVTIIIALLVTLVLSLQFGSSGLFLAFWAIWLVAIITMMLLPSRSPEIAEDQTEEKAEDVVSIEFSV